MRAARRAFYGLLIIAAVLEAPAGAAARRGFSVAPGSLGRAIAELAQQAGIDIGATDPALSSRYTAGVRGTMSPEAALRRLLTGTGFRAVAVGEGGFRLVAEPRKAPPVRVATAPLPKPEAVPDDIVVIASKHSASLLRFPGGVSVVQAENRPFGLSDSRDIHALAGTLPIVQATELGNGRNKLFVRGVADSSFTGPTRSTASVYFDEAQLGYNGADPNLNLYDVGRVEVLEGPQGALYGAGSIGGIIRVLPRMPDAGGLSASAVATGAATQGGAMSHGGAAMANVPVVRDILAVRAVGYGAWDGGYIDDTRRGLSNINRSRTVGWRAAGRLTPGDGWTMDLGFVHQENRAPDTQYALRGLPALTRTSSIAQPFEGDFSLRQLVLRKEWDSGLRLVASTAHVKHHSDDRYDATPRARPTALFAYDTRDRNALTTHEARLSRSVANGNSWLLGVSYIDDLDRIERTLGAPGAPQDIAGITNSAKDLSGFGEVTVALTDSFSVSAGGRFTRTSTESDPAFIRAGSSFIRGVKTSRLSPMLATSLLLTPRLAWFTRYGSGFRTGGLAVAPGVGRVANFQPDSIRVIETGLRLQRSGETGLSGMIGVSNARWEAIQADLVTRGGFPYTTNIGDGRINGIEATAEWIPLKGLVAEGALFFNDSRLTNPVVQLLPQEGDDLADTPRIAASGRVTRSWTTADGQRFSLAATGQYTGHSYVGFGPMLDIKQGDYAVFGASAGWQGRMLGLSLDIDNIANSHGNRFSLGNPFGIADRNQITPVRPRTARLTLTWRAAP